MYSTVYMITRSLYFAPSPPSAHPLFQRSRVGGSSRQVAGPGGEGDCPSACPGRRRRVCLLHLQPPCPRPPHLVSTKLNESCWSTSRVQGGGAGGGGALPVPSARSLALVALVRQNFVVFSFPFMADFDKNAKQGLIFFSTSFEFSKCEHLSSSVTI